MSTRTNRALGAAIELGRIYPNGGVMVLLETTEDDATLMDYADLASLLAAPGNTELAVAGYARKTGLAVTVNVDNATNKATASVPQQTFEGLEPGGTIRKAIMGIATGAGDANVIPLGALDMFALTDGNPINITWSEGYFYEAS